MLFDECVCGLLAGKTRVLATHQVHHLAKADCIVVLDSAGRIAAQGDTRLCVCLCVCVSVSVSVSVPVSVSLSMCRCERVCQAEFCHSPLPLLVVGVP